MYHIKSRDNGQIVASVQFDPYRYSVKEPNHPGVRTVLAGMKGRKQMNRTAVDPPDDPDSTSLEELQEPSKEFILDRIAVSVQEGYTVVKADTSGKIGVAELVDDEAMDFLKGVLDKVTNSNTPKRRRDLWKAFLNRVVLRKISAAAEWNPALHPRDPETGQFVERPFSVPDDIRSMDTPDIVRELAASDPEFSDKVEGLDIDMDEDLQSLVDEANGGDGETGGETSGGLTDLPDDAPEPSLPSSDLPVSEGGPREIPNNPSADEIANSIPTVTERFGDELDAPDKVIVPDQKIADDTLERAREHVGENLSRVNSTEMKEHVAARISHIGGPGETGTRSSAGRASLRFMEHDEDKNAIFGSMNLADDVADTTISHELQHAVDRIMGYTFGGERSGSNGGFHDYDTENPFKAATEHDKSAADAMGKFRNSDEPLGLEDFYSNVRDEVELDEDGNVEELDSDVIQKRLNEDLPDDPAEAYRRFIVEANRAWFKTQHAYNKGGQSAATDMVKMPYQMTNVSEFTAVFAETLHNGEFVDNFAIEGYLRHHPGLLNAALNIWGVPEGVKDEIETQKKFL